MTTLLWLCWFDTLCYFMDVINGPITSLFDKQHLRPAKYIVDLCPLPHLNI